MKLINQKTCTFKSIVNQKALITFLIRQRALLNIPRICPTHASPCQPPPSRVTLPSCLGAIVLHLHPRPPLASSGLFLLVSVSRSIVKAFHALSLVLLLILSHVPITPAGLPSTRFSSLPGNATFHLDRDAHLRRGPG